ncbi:phosphomannomutase [Pseudoalteromonas sp. G4]|uniref:phosphomannomutase n=1 Tax=Pseudoalteromonas sp. G4 TaxID=2992761 RepID=UPI00237E39F1|nr:phosphomannomutase [Pseudoalteromonas sp. G4]
MLSTKHIIENSGVAFGTSGARGLVSDFTPEVCAAFAISFASVLQKEAPVITIAVAIDNRPSSYQMAQAICAGLAQLCITAEFYGVIPTPALAFYAMQHTMPCIMVTGSHIPFDRNGLKFYRPKGEITKTDETAILSASVNLEPIESLPELTELSDAKSTYIQRNTEAFSPDTLTGKRIGIYEHSSAGRDIYKSIFEALGATVISLGRSDEFVPIDTEAVSEDDKQKAREWVKLHQLNALFSTDGDGDRPLLSDENGEWLRGDVLGLLCSKILGIESLATPVSCNTAIEKSGLFKHVARTKIGSPYVIAEFDWMSAKYKSVAGFEANGGYILASEVSFNDKIIKPLPTRDAVLPVIAVLSQIKSNTVQALVKALPKRFTASDRIKNFAREKSLALISSISKEPATWLEKLQLSSELGLIDETDGYRMTFANSHIVHLRPSGNAPELRCYVETDSEVTSEQVVSTVLKSISLL